ncbi:MAG: 3-phosphoshikimate 1-carboxyvinyltransferase, partial [Anaerolineales bacterium]
MKLTAAPGQALQGNVVLPGDKSISHRAILFSALANGQSVIENLLVAGVSRAMLNALTALGVPWELQGTKLSVQGAGLPGLHAPSGAIDCGNSATTMRLLAGALAAAGIPAVLDGSPGLRKRPMRRIVQPLRQMGVPIQATQGRAPLELQSRDSRLRPLDYHLPVASAQLKTCLLLAALAANGTTTLYEPGPSRDHTERMLKSMDVAINHDKVNGQALSTREGLQPYAVVTLTSADPQSLLPLRIRIPGDISSAAFLIVAALITPGSKIVIREVGLNPTRTGLLDALRKMGADIDIVPQSDQGGEPVGDLHVRASRLKGIQISGPLVVRMIDEFPAFAVAAAFAVGKTTVREAQELRYKETDRIAVLCNELKTLGVAVQEQPDGFTLAGNTPPIGGLVKAHGDHRLAMALAVAGLGAEKVITVQGAEILNESFP